METTKQKSIIFLNLLAASVVAVLCLWGIAALFSETKGSLDRDFWLLGGFAICSLLFVVLTAVKTVKEIRQPLQRTPYTALMLNGWLCVVGLLLGIDTFGKGLANINMGEVAALIVVCLGLINAVVLLTTRPKPI